jgi:uncharacterized protein
MELDSYCPGGVVSSHAARGQHPIGVEGPLRRSIAQQLLTVVVGIVGGTLGHVSGLPAGPLLGAIVAVGALNLLADDRAAVPVWLAVGARMLIGAVIGSLVTRELMGELGRTVAWALLFAVIVIVVGLGAGVMIHRVTGLELRSAMIGSCPGGMPEMAALAQEVGAEVDVVLGMHLARKLIALSVIVVALVVAT